MPRDIEEGRETCSRHAVTDPKECSDTYLRFHARAFCFTSRVPSLHGRAMAVLRAARIPLRADGVDRDIPILGFYLKRFGKRNAR